uniref:Uncharacterized protein n=1 Tax=Anguilla anguilla TaxID=7936 RepID=A0A0E9UC50_ANGAN
MQTMLIHSLTISTM